MINAKEAKALFDQSGQEVADYLKNKVEPVVIKAATLGKRTVFICLDSTSYIPEIPDKITPVHRSVVEALKDQGYTVKIAQDGIAYVPHGLQNDDGVGPLHTNYGFHISW